jgi:FAD/FMN-containing dehydrogenase
MAMNPVVLEALQSRLGPGRFLVGEQVPERFMSDRTRQPPTRPAAVALPGSAEEVAAVLAVCHAHRQPVVTQGGLTGLCGGAHPRQGEVGLSLEKLVGVEEVDLESGTLTALAGTTLQSVQQAAEDAGLMCGIDLGARGSCTIGGNVATNAGGNQVIRYGMTRRNVLGLEVALADGRIVRSLNKMLKNNTGYDWTQLFCGSEGTLGVITRVVLQLHARPRGVQTAVLAVPDTARGLALLRALEKELPAGLLVFEALWREMYETAVHRVGLTPPVALGQDLYLLVEAPMGDGGREAFDALLGAMHERGLLVDAAVAESGAQRARMWGLRESVYEYEKVFRFVHGYDISVPLNRMAEAIELLRAAAPRLPEGVRLVSFGHMADSNIHLLAVADRPGDADDAHHCDEVVYDCTHAVGGSISAEHGIGVLKRPYLHLSRTAPELELMAQMKQMLDPHGILNPGRVL